MDQQKKNELEFDGKMEMCQGEIFGLLDLPVCVCLLRAAESFLQSRSCCSLNRNKRQILFNYITVKYPFSPFNGDVKLKLNDFLSIPVVVRRAAGKQRLYDRAHPVDIDRFR